MFDLITGDVKHLPSQPTLPIVASTMAQVVIVTVILAVPLLYATDQLPQVPTMMAFVAAPPAPPPPPPPPPAPAKPRPQTAEPVPTSDRVAAPIEAPIGIQPEPDDEGFDEGVPGGVEGGVPGGVVGGVLGSLMADIPPPPPPPARRSPVRTGGQIQTPALIRRVEPIYPPIAVQAHLEGMVILEAIVDEDGRVADVKVLRSAGVLLDREALIAVKQWQYSPLLLNGIRERFILTVTLSFNLEKSSE